ncbi:MAG: transporter substrate-binding domain-containing protein, partial [Armatimonadetes bacterium]|nr:transporter substrate-binding domain-containing protein [Anaerolineae bacterium]
EAVANGQADFAVGVQANWEWDERVDFSGPYLLRGLRLLLKQNSNTFGFEELRGGRYVAYPIEQPELQALAISTAEEFNAVIRTYGAREQDLARAIVDENNADAAFADSIALLPFIEQYANQTVKFQLSKRWYSEEYMVLATPRNDPDFRRLTDYTLQALVADGTLTRLLAPVMLPEDVPAFDVYPGMGDTFGFNLGANP